jgi:AbrB family looped-hinge helix DNA binding protein
MPVARVSSKGQITIPKEIRDALHLKINDKVALVVEGGVAIIKPIRGNILDIGASVKIPGKSKPVDFKKVRKEVIKRVAGRAAARGR